MASDNAALVSQLARLAVLATTALRAPQLIRYPNDLPSVVVPETPSPNRVLICFHSPPATTCASHARRTEESWNPFHICCTDDFVQSFRQLETELGGTILRDFLASSFLLDVFAHLIWSDEVKLVSGDYALGIVWLKRHVKIIKPTHLVVASEEGWKVANYLLKTWNAEEMQSPQPLLLKVPHPSATNRDQAKAKQSWLHAYAETVSLEGIRLDPNTN